MRAHGPDRGASTIEYAGLIVLAALILGSLTAIGIPGTIRDGLTPALCKIVGGTSCGGNSTGPPDTDRGRPPDGDLAPGSNQPPVAAGKDPGLLPSLGKTLGHYFQGFENFAGFSSKTPTSTGYQPTYPSDPGIIRELWEQVKGVGSFAKMTWCATGLMPAHGSQRRTRRLVISFPPSGRGGQTNRILNRRTMHQAIPTPPRKCQELLVRSLRHISCHLFRWREGTIKTREAEQARETWETR